MIKKNDYIWIILLGCILLQFGGTGFINNIYTLFYNPIGVELHFSNTELSFFSTIRIVSMAFGMFIIPKMYGKYKLSLILSFCCIVQCAVFTAQGYFTHIYQWYMVGPIAGFAAGGLVTIPSTIVINNWFTKYKGTALGITLASAGIGGAIASQIASNLILVYGWRSTVAIMALISMLITLPATLFIIKLKPYDIADHNDKDKMSVHKKYTSDFAGHKCLITVLTCLLIVGIPSGILQLTQQFSLMTFTADNELAFIALLTSLCMIGNTFGKVFLGILNDRLGAMKSLIIMFLLMATVCIAFPLGNNVVKEFCALILGTSFSVSTLSPAMLGDVFFQSDYDSIVSKLNAFGTFSGAAVSTAIGFISDKTGTYDYIFAVFSILCLICVLISILLMKRTETGNEKV